MAGVTLQFLVRQHGGCLSGFAAHRAHSRRRACKSPLRIEHKTLINCDIAGTSAELNTFVTPTLARYRDARLTGAFDV